MIDQVKLEELTELYLKSLISEELDVGGVEFDSFTPFAEMGVNSFHVLKIIKKLESDFGALPKTLLFENFNIDDLSRYFIKKHQGTLATKFASELGGDATPSPSVITEPCQANEAVIPTHESIVLLETDLDKNAQCKAIVESLLTRFQNETSISRGTRNIAPYLFIGKSHRGYFNFSRAKNILLVYAYTGEPEYLKELTKELWDYCQNHALELNLFSDIAIKNVGDIPFSATPFGVVQRVVDLQSFTLQGSAMRRLRYQVSKFNKNGDCFTKEYQCGTDPQTDTQIAHIIDQWCEQRTMVNPLIYKVKEEILSGTLAPVHRLFLTYLNDTLQNVILISSMASEDNGYLMDLEFYPKNMPLGGLEFGIVEMIKLLVKEGCNLLSLGGTYGCKLAPSDNPDPQVDKALDELRELKIFNDEGNMQFKNKFRPVNETIYLCRALEGSDPNNIIDIIMMIADPEKALGNTENNTAATPEKAVSKHKEQAKPQLNVAPTLSGDSTEYLTTLQDNGFNPLNIPVDKVRFDLKTDSWAKLSNPFIKNYMARLHGQLQQPIEIKRVLESIIPLPYIALTNSGELAEHALCQAWPNKGLVLQNLLFPTWLFNQIGNGLSAVELPHSSAFKISVSDENTSAINIDALHNALKASDKPVAFVCMELSTNAVGGHPVSIEHLAHIKQMLSQYSVPLVLDATRVVDNALLLKARSTTLASVDTWQVVRQLLQQADAITMSLGKNFCVDKGGVVAVKDPALFAAIEQVIEQHSSGVDALDKKLIAHAMTHKEQIVGLVDRRVSQAIKISQTLKHANLPIAHAEGGHCVLVDTKQIAPFNTFEQPVASFIAWLYSKTGICAGEHSVGMQKDSALNGLVRIAIPAGMTNEAAATVAELIVNAWTEFADIPQLALQDGQSGIGDIHCSYAVKQYHNTTCTQDAQEAETVKEVLADEVQKECANEAPSVPLSASETNNQARGAKVQSHQADTPMESKLPGKDIAVIGMAGRYPGANNLDELWQNLLAGEDSITEIPDERFNSRRYNGAYSKYRGGFIDAVDRFDSVFFNIAPREAESMDPQERLFLEVAWEALEDAGYYPEILSAADQPRRVGVFVGAVWTMYQTLGAEERLLGEEIITNSFLWSIANRVSYYMNLSGPSMAVDTACSASLTALHLACEAIHNRECDSAIVGGVNLDLHAAKQQMSWAGGALSEDGVCRSFGQGANGYVAGEGVGAIYIKELQQAIADGDNIQGVIKGVAVNHGGKSSGYSVPNPNAQADVILAALKKADIDANTIGFIEAHGTGTELGDPIEISGLNKAFAEYNVDKQSCAIGSIKTNIGHLEAAAGLVGVCKVLLQMKHEQLAPSLHAKQLNEFIDFADSPFMVQQSASPWTPKTIAGQTYPMRAGVSSFGAGGSNAHVILEQYVDAKVQADLVEQALIFPLSARSEAQLHEMAKRLIAHLQRHQTLQGDLNHLINMSHTLRTGRRDFAHRVAVIAADHSTLIAKLQHYVDGKPDEEVIVGNVKNNDELSELLSGAEKQDVIQAVVQNKNNKKLAQLWARGFLADWQLCHHLPNGKRVSLPTYPFADKRHWVPATKSIHSGELSASSALHPMIDSNESTFERQVFKKTFTDKEFFIFDHLVSDIPTLPGVAYLDFARKAGELAVGRPVNMIKNIVWLSPLTVEQSVPNEVFVELTPKGHEVQFEFYSDKEDGTRQVYSQGRLNFDPQTQQQDEYIDIETIRERCVEVVNAEQAYPLFKSLGLHLGPSFQTLQTVYKSEGEVLGQLSLPEIANSNKADYVLHPSLVDGSFQALMGAQLGGGQGAGGGMVVPYSLGEVEILHPITSQCYSYVVEANPGKQSKLSKKNVFIVDEQGKVLVKIRDSVGVPLTEVHEKPSSAAHGFEQLHYETTWLTTEQAQTEQQSVSGTVLLFACDEGLREAYREQNGASSSVILVKPGTSFTQEDAHTYTVSPGSEADISQVFAQLSNTGADITHLVFAWSCDNTDNVVGNGDDTALRQALQLGVYSFLFVCKEVALAKMGCQITHLSLFEQDKVQPHNDAISGFLNIFVAENPKLVCTVLEVESTASQFTSLANILLSESNARKSNTVRYSNGQRLVRKITHFDMSEALLRPDADNAAIKEQGVYLITGGAGGLGFIFAEFLAKEFKARLVLTGRSPLSDAQSEKLAKLKDLGGDAIYIAADISQYAEVARVVTESQQAFGSLNGVIHSAGVLRDAYVRNKSAKDLDDVFAAKVFGTTHLDQVTKDLDLDFFVLFSSLAALAGNAGQSDYAYANHFMDAFAQGRAQLVSQGERSGRSLSINWSIWAEGGMQLDEQTAHFFKQNLGISPLETQVGIQAFVQGLNTDKARFAIIEGDQEKIERAWGLTEAVEPVAQETPLSATDNTASSSVQDDELTTQVQQQLSDIVMDFLKLDKADIDLDSILMDLGFDSIGLSTFANAINDIYGTDATPVLFFEYPSLREISAHLVDEHIESVAQVHQGSQGAGAVQVETANEQVNEHAAAVITNKGWTPDSATPAQAAPSSFSFENRFIDMPIAIVGASGTMPQSDNLKEYWEKLRDSENNMVTLIPEDRWDWQEYYGDPLKEENKTLSKWGGFMREVDKFDPLFWGISPREAEMMDPQQRIFLETVWSTIEDAGHKVSDLAGSKTGLFVGAATRDYIDLMGAQDVELNGYSASGTSHAVLANRVSFLLDLHGPSAPLDTACSSSLVALHRAIESIHTGSCDMAIVGGVQVMLTPAAHISFGAAGMLASDGRCKTFDERADGYVRGEGSGAILIKPLSKAVEEGNHIYAVVKATAENHGGKATMLTAPNPNAQADLLIEAYEKAKIDPTTVGFIECHGTGTSLGDPIEIQSMKKAFSVLYKQHNKPKAEVPHIALTSAKSNIGHLETSAGIAGILKVLMSMKHKQIPALLHFEKQNPYIDLKGTPFYMADKTHDWEPVRDPQGNAYPRRAGISSFGFGGANVHVVLEEYTATPTVSMRDEAMPIVLSAKSTERLKVYAQLMLTHLEETPVSLADFAYTLQVGRDAMKDRIGFVASSIAEVKTKLNAYIAEQTTPDIYQSPTTKGSERADIAPETIAHWFDDNNLDELVAAWVNGHELDWQRLYHTGKPTRVSLPTYPFERQRCWFDVPTPALNDETQATSKVVQLHPLVHENTSTLAQQSYQSRFTGDEFFIAAGADGATSTHQLGVASFFEMARVAHTLAVAPQELGGHYVLDDLVWSPSTIFDVTQPVSIAVYEQEDEGVIEVEVLGSQEEILFQASVEGLAAQADTVIDLAHISQNIAANGLFEQTVQDYISSDTCDVTQVKADSTALLIGLKLSDKLVNAGSDFVLHPALLEPVLTAAIGLSCGFNKQSANQPIKVETVHVHAAMPENIYAWIRYSKAYQNNDVVKLDIDLTNEMGKVITTLRGVTFELATKTDDTSDQADEFISLLEVFYSSDKDKLVSSKHQEHEAQFEQLLAQALMEEF
ncbi:SDR family NAD(P)-dependent oxidoreductase [Pseudoalteromonas sp. J010]|uniref:SDR family NAD(P)-dependent oxidoreductase n=1 Tax=Pseudoalteromonas sp. J010 TaxID=998465 RepID=UPI000F645F6E|nr:SDR family NAD(P)-dependent oxidoreductase [Pseudoalteromonas sp. J010]RRS06759.1 SDR family NAD(P)-dependent oxidoreductase [Pseudoalteromonas sp. J010]